MKEPCVGNAAAGAGWGATGAAALGTSADSATTIGAGALRRQSSQPRGRLIDHPMQRLRRVASPQRGGDCLGGMQRPGVPRGRRRRPRRRRKRPRRVLTHDAVRQIPQRQPFEALLRRALVVR